MLRKFILLLSNNVEDGDDPTHVVFHTLTHIEEDVLSPRCSGQHSETPAAALAGRQVS